MIKYIKNNIDLKRNIREIVKNYNNYYIKITCYSEDDYEEICTDLNIEIFSDDNYIETIVYSSIKENTVDNTQLWWDVVENHRESLKKEKKKIFNYIDKNFRNVSIIEDYVC